MCVCVSVCLCGGYLESGMSTAGQVMLLKAGDFCFHF